MSYQPTVQQLLFVLRAADFELTTDQQFTKLFQGTKWRATLVIAERKTGAFDTSCLGGIYNAAAKGGDALIAAAQSWAGLTGAGKMVEATLAAVVLTDVQSTVDLFLSLSTGNASALTADVYVYGVCLD